MIISPVVAALRGPLSVVVGTFSSPPAFLISRMHCGLSYGNRWGSHDRAELQIAVVGDCAMRAVSQRRKLKTQCERILFRWVSAGLVGGVLSQFAFLLVLVNFVA